MLKGCRVVTGPILWLINFDALKEECWILSSESFHVVVYRIFIYSVPFTFVDIVTKPMLLVEPMRTVGSEIKRC